jgi:hypothetical protein
MDNVALADLSRRLRQLAKTRNLFLTKPRAVEKELDSYRVDDVDLLNWFATGTVTNEIGPFHFRVEGRLDDGSQIALHVLIDEIHDQKANRPAPRVRIDKVSWPKGAPERRSRPTKKVEIVRKLRRIQ